MDHETFMRRAIELARHGALERRDGGPFGAVVVRDGEIVGEGWNQVVAQGDPTLHGEIVAIRAACARLGTHDLGGCVLYTSAEPCPMCMAACHWARLDAVYYASTCADAKEFGDFDDSHIYRELTRPPAERSLPLHNLLRAEALPVWHAYRNLPDRRWY